MEKGPYLVSKCIFFFLSGPYSSPINENFHSRVTLFNSELGVCVVSWAVPCTYSCVCEGILVDWLVGGYTHSTRSDVIVTASASSLT